MTERERVLGEFRRIDALYEWDNKNKKNKKELAAATKLLNIFFFILRENSRLKSTELDGYIYLLVWYGKDSTTTGVRGIKILP